MKALIGNKAGIQGRLAWVFSAFMLLVIVSVALTFWGLERARQDASVINLAERQRMLIQQMARLSVEFSQEGEDHYRGDLLEAAGAFERTLLALRNGGVLTDYTGQTLVLAPPDDRDVLQTLDALIPEWQLFRTRLDQLSARRAGGQEIDSLVPGLMDGTDRVVQAYEAAAEGKITQLHSLQLAFLFSGLVLVGLGWWTVQALVVHPVQQLAQSARRIGQGDLESPVKIMGPTEVVALGTEMETTRRQLRASRAELQTWVDGLEERVRRRTAALEALATVSRDITSHLDIGAVLESVTGKAQQLLSAEVAELCLLDAEGRQLRLHATAGPEVAVLCGASAIPESTVHPVLSGQAARICDAGGCPGFCDILEPAYRASHLVAPVRLDTRVIGALCVGSTHPGTFRPDALTLLTQLAQAAAVALENSRLYEQAQRGATLMERQRIASEMHDGLLQTLSFLRWMTLMTGEQLAQGDVAQARTTLDKIARANAQAESEIRRAISSLQENSPVQVTLQEQLAAAIAETSPAEPAVDFENQVNVPIVLPRPDAEQVLRVMREALLNAQRYSHAQHIRVCLNKAERELALVVEDDGIGFDPASLPDDDRPHFGVKIMLARAARLGGQIHIDTAPGQGTRVTLRWISGEESP